MSEGREFVVDRADDGTVRGFLHRAEGAGASGYGLVLTHGAGANCNAPLLVALAEAFWASGWSVLRCDLPFRQARPTGPPMRTAEKDQQGLKAAVAAMRKEVAGQVYLGGHSYGGRMATMLCAAEPGVADGLLLLSYPLHPPQKPQEWRTAHFPSLQVPAMFVQGTRDGFATEEEIAAALRLIPARTELMTIAGAGHELVGKKNSEDAVELIVKEFRRFVQA